MVRSRVSNTACLGRHGVLLRRSTPARSGVEHNGENSLAESPYLVGSEIKDSYPELTMAMLKKLGWDGDLTDSERASIEKVASDKTN